MSESPQPGESQRAGVEGMSEIVPNESFRKGQGRDQQARGNRYGQRSTNLFVDLFFAPPLGQINKSLWKKGSVNQRF